MRHCATSRMVGDSITDGVIGIFYGPGVDSASNRKEYQEYFLERVGGYRRPVRMADILTTFHVPIVLKSESLNLLEP